MSAAAVSRGSARRGARPRPADEVTPTPALPALVLAVLGGFAALLSFPPYDLWMLLPLAIAALTASVMTRSWGTAALASLAWGLAFFVPLTIWAKTYAGIGPWLALGLFEALYILVFGPAARVILVRRGLGPVSAILVSALWAGTEYLRSSVPWGGLSWGASAFALQSSPLLNLGPWIGTAGLAFVVALLGQFVLGGVLGLLRRRQRGCTGLSGVWPLAIAVGAVLVTMVVPLPKNPAPADDTMAIAGVQGNMHPVDPASMLMSDEIFPNQLEATEQAVADARAEGLDLDLVVWPEDSTGWDPRQDGWRGEAITAAARSAEAPILIGTQTLIEDDTARLNSSLLWTQDGTVAHQYDKRHPVPFGEYIPARSFFRLLSDKVDLISVDMRAGEEVGVTTVGEHPIGILICFEIAYEELVQDVVLDGAEVIVVQSNNALFGDTHEAIQQVAEAKVFAVISGRSVVHVSTVGHSAIFTPQGRTLDFQDHWTQGAVIAEVPLATGITPAVAAGPWIHIGLSALGALGVLVSLASPRRAIARPARSQRSEKARARGRIER